MSDLQDAVEILIRSLPEERRERLRFMNGRPGRNFCNAFQKRHADKLSFCKPSKQEALIYLATNAESLTDHLAKIERLIRVHRIDAQRFINIDESGVSADGYNFKSTPDKVYCTRSTRPETVHARFSNVNRITILGCIHTSGYIGRPMFVLQGTRLRYRMCKRKDGTGRGYDENIAERLPRHCLVVTRPDVAGVDKTNFVAWAKAIANDLRELTSNNRKVLLVYDGYRSHMCLEALEIFRANGIIAYALPSHTSGTTQPLDRTVFEPFKRHYRDLLDTFIARRKRNDPPLDEFDVCQLISAAYTKSFTSHNVKAGFYDTGLYPFDPSQLLCRPRILNETQSDKMIDIDTMMDMFQEKRRLRSRELLDENIILERGFIDTSRGVVLTSTRAMELLRDELAVKMRKEKLKKEKEERVGLQEQDTYAAKKEQRLRNVVAAMHRRNKLYGERLTLPRTIAKKREVSRRMAASKKGTKEWAHETTMVQTQKIREDSSIVRRGIRIDESYD